MKKSYNSVIIADIELELGVVVAESHAQHILQALTNHETYLFKSLACKLIDDRHSFEKC